MWSEAARSQEVRIRAGRGTCYLKPAGITHSSNMVNVFFNSRHAAGSACLNMCTCCYKGPDQERGYLHSTL